MSRSSLGERELDILQVLWDGGSATVGEVHTALEKRRVHLAYNTVQTVLNRLEAKGVVSRDQRERAHRYRAEVSETSFTAGALRRFLQRFFNGSAEALAASLVERNLDDEEIDRLEQIIER